MQIVRVLGVAMLVAVCTWFLGWWSVPVCGAAYALLRPGRDGVVREAALGAMLAWSAMLAWQVANPSFGRLSAAVGGLFPVPVVVLMVIAIAFAGVLAGAAARLLRQD